MKRRVIVTLFALIAVLLVVSPVLAYIYRATYTVISENTTDFEMLGVNATGVGNQWMADNGFFNSTANDTRIETLGGLDKPHMVTDDKTFTAIPVPAGSQTNLYFTTGESEQDFCIIPGYGGYVTVDDEDSIELGDNFTVEQSGWVDATALPDGGIEDFTTYIEVDVPGKITVTAGNVTGVDVDRDEEIYLYKDKGVGFFDALVVDFEIYIDSASLDECYGGMALSKIIGTINDWVHTTEMTVVVHRVGAQYRITLIRGRLLAADFFVIAADTPYYCTVLRAKGSDSVTVQIYTDEARLVLVDTLTLPGYGAVKWRYIYGFVSRNTGDAGRDWDGYIKNLAYTFKVLVEKPGAFETYIASTGNITSTILATSVSATGISSGEMRVTTSANITHLSISIDGVQKHIKPLGAAAPPNAFDWAFMRNNSMPYSDNTSIEVDGVLELWFRPNDIISGTTLPDRATPVANDGTFTFGSNPDDVTVIIGGLVSSSQPSPGVTIEDPAPDIMPGVEVTDWYIEPDVGVGGALLTNPMRPFVTMMSDTTTLTELQAWRILGTALVLFVLVATAKAVRGHHLITGIATGACILGLVVWTIYPMWALVFMAFAVISGLISERTPSV